MSNVKIGENPIRRKWKVFIVPLNYYKSDRSLTVIRMNNG